MRGDPLIAKVPPKDATSSDQANDKQRLLSIYEHQ